MTTIEQTRPSAPWHARSAVEAAAELKPYLHRPSAPTRRLERRNYWNHRLAGRGFDGCLGDERDERYQAQEERDTAAASRPAGDTGLRVRRLGRGFTGKDGSQSV